MTKQLLADQLRERLSKAGPFPMSDLDSLSDDTIIASYNICSCCGDKFLTDLQLNEAIEISNSAEDFIAISYEIEYENKILTQN